MPPRHTRAVTACSVHAALAIATTWPLALDWRTRIPLGAENVATVPEFNLWTLRWNAERLAHGFRGYWDAPIFWPTKGTFARSEAQPLTGLLYALLHPFGGDVGAYNLTLWSLLVLNGLALTLLARRLGATFVPALLAGALGQTLAFVFNELGVLQLAPLFPLWLLLERLVAYHRAPSAARLGAAGAWLGVMALVSGYYALFTALALLVIGPLLVAGRRSSLRLLAELAIAAVVAATIAAPFSLAQRANTGGETWSDETVLANSARPLDWIQRDGATVPVPWARERAGGTALFAGGILLGLATLGVVVSTRRRDQRLVIGCLGAVTVLVLVSFGTRVRWGDVAPYTFLRDHVDGFDRLRSPFRAAAIAHAFIAVLAALALAWMWRRPAGRILAVAFVVGSVVETIHWDQPTATVPDVARFDWVQWLHDAPEGAVAMVPFPGSGSVYDYEATTIAMLAGLEHGHPLVNGYTGLFPETYRQLRAVMQSFPDRASIAQLGKHDVRYIVVRHDFALYAVTTTALPELGYDLAFAGDVRDVWVTRQPSSPATTP